jgi:hypothetical protein
VNRFFDNTVEFGEEGDGFTPPQVESKGSSGGNENDDLFEDHLEDALCVFKTGGINKDILEQNEKQILFFINFEEEEIIEKDQYSLSESNNEKIEGCHPILFNQYPICKNHSLILLFAFEGLP